MISRMEITSMLRSIFKLIKHCVLFVAIISFSFYTYEIFTLLFYFAFFVRVPNPLSLQKKH